MKVIQRVTLLGRAGALPGARTCSGPHVEAKMPRSGSIGHKAGDLVPELAALIPQLPRNQEKKASQMPWVKQSEAFFETWSKIAPCMPKYEAFLRAHKASTAKANIGHGLVHDIKEMSYVQGGKVMSDEAQIALSEFYMAVAIKLRPEQIDAAGSGNEEILKVTRECAEQDFEPFIEQGRGLIADYDQQLHNALQETTPLYEVDDGLFWRANFDVAAPAEFRHYLTALGHGWGQSITDDKAYVSPAEVKRAVAQAKESMSSGEARFEPACRAAEMVYDKWLQASSMPVKASISQLLMEHGFIVGANVDEHSTLLPEPVAK